MFTGIVEAKGKLLGRRRVAGAVRLLFEHPFGADAIRQGDSVAVQGCCLTAVDPDESGFGADVSPETLKLTTMGTWRDGREVNLERALTPTSRMGGHFVTGHVDGLGELVSSLHAGGCWTMTFQVPGDLARYLASKASVTIDGISLTIAGLDGARFSVAVIPTTREVTTLGGLRVGEKVHLEMDILAKYVEALLGGKSGGVTRNLLASAGFAS